jgi:eukaryotic-like serine/threonine-protein kinase
VIWDRWEEVDRLFAAAQERPPAEREGFLRASCGDDADLLRLVRSLLTEADVAASFGGPGSALLRSVWSEPAAAPRDEAPLRPGERVGRYRVTGELGRGGMAVVYAAERDDGVYQQQVALKVLRPGIDADLLVGRFVHERQILARLAHPRIARLLDGGATADGRPYLVMERVDGTPITHYADAHRLAIRERLRLLLGVADAVRYAHQRLIVHRDLKPSNILVDGTGEVRLLDFGVAKLLGDVDEAQGPLTRAVGRAHTPEYASPEQVRGEPATTASDVYQLGLLLYELLTGQRPFAGRGVQLETAITDGRVTRPSDVTVDGESATESDPPQARPAPADVARARGTTPAALRRALRGDLDTIALKALRTEPDERYSSVEALAEDIRSHLAGRPIAARVPSVPYRVRKFAQRNRWLPPVAAVLTLALAGYVTTLALHARTLELERNEARAHAERADELRGFMIDLFGAADPFAAPEPGRNRDITVVEALDVGTQRARLQLADRPLLLADMLSAVGGVYANLDERDAAISTLEEAITTRVAAGAAESVQHLDDLHDLAGVIGVHVGADSAITLQRRRLELERRLHGTVHPRVGAALLALSAHMVTSGRFDEALEQRIEAIRILRAAGPAAAGDLADALALTADTYTVFDRIDEAEAAAREAVEIGRRVLGTDHPNTAWHTVHLAQLLTNRERYDEAIDIYRDVLPILERSLGPEHYITLRSTNNYAVTLTAGGDHVGAERVYRELLETRRAQAAGGLSRDVADVLQNLAVAVNSQGRTDESERLIREAHAIYREVLPPGHYLLAFPLLSLAEIQLSRGDALAAEQTAQEAAGILSAALPPGHFATAVARCRLGAALALQSRTQEALPLLDNALEELRGSELAPERFRRECAEHREALSG